MQFHLLRIRHSVIAKSYDKTRRTVIAQIPHVLMDDVALTNRLPLDPAKSPFSMRMPLAYGLPVT